MSLDSSSDSRLSSAISSGQQGDDGRFVDLTLRDHTLRPGAGPERWHTTASASEDS